MRHNADRTATDTTRATPTRRLRNAALLLGATAALGTTAVMTALEPKLPPFRGD